MSEEITKYILKRDLPFAKAGEEVNLYRSGDETVVMRINECMGGLRIPTLNEDEWIQKINTKEVIEETTKRLQKVIDKLDESSSRAGKFNVNMFTYAKNLIKKEMMDLINTCE
jgi:hypothetical protein